MAHNVESMMYVGVPPWHGLGTSVRTEVRSDEALRLGGLDWTVSTLPLCAAHADGSRVPVTGWSAVVRGRDAKALGVVGARYQPIQNIDAFKFFDGVVGAGEAIYHTAGSLDGGRRVWILAKLGGEIRVARDDVTEKFLLLTNTHDGTSALRMLFTPVRVVCQNTLNLALGTGAGDGISIRHTSSATRRLDQAREVLGFARNYYDRFEKDARRLTAAPFSDEQMRSLSGALFPSAVDGPSPRVLRAREKLVELLETGRGHEGIRGTAWAALNAVAEYADHHRPTRSRDPRTRAEGAPFVRVVRDGLAT